MYVPKDDKIRHKILCALTEKMESYASKGIADFTQLWIKLHDFKSQLNLTDADLNRVATTLIPEEEIQYERDQDGDMCVVGNKNTVNSFYSKKYLKKGKDYVLGRTKDYLNIVVSSIAIITAIITTTTSLVSIRINQQQIKELKQQVAALQKKVQGSTRP